MKGIIEQEIENYADKNGSYPKTVEVSQREFTILEKEIIKELKTENIPIPAKIDKFRGCQLIINKKITKFKVM